MSEMEFILLWFFDPVMKSLAVVTKKTQNNFALFWHPNSLYSVTVAYLIVNCAVSREIFLSLYDEVNTLNVQCAHVVHPISMKWVYWRNTSSFNAWIQVLSSDTDDSIPRLICQLVNYVRLFRSSLSILAKSRERCLSVYCHFPNSLKNFHESCCHASCATTN